MFLKSIQMLIIAVCVKTSVQGFFEIAPPVKEEIYQLNNLLCCGDAIALNSNSYTYHYRLV